MTFSIHGHKRHFALLCCPLANDTNNKGRKESLMRRKKYLETKEKRKSHYFYPYSNTILKETLIRGKEMSESMSHQTQEKEQKYCQRFFQGMSGSLLKSPEIHKYQKGICRMVRILLRLFGKWI